MKTFKIILLILCVFISGCRGYRSEKPPVHASPNMDWQPKYEDQEYSAPIPKNTVAWGNVDGWSNNKKREKFNPQDKAYYEGKNSKGTWVKKAPITVTESIVKRGQDRYNIYCSMCHGQTGEGNGLVVQRGYTRPAAYWDNRLLKENDGYIFDVITNGKRSMWGYKKQIPVEDRWAIVTYVRALQKAKTAKKSDLLDKHKKKLNLEK